MQIQRYAQHKKKEKYLNIFSHFTSIAIQTKNIQSQDYSEQQSNQQGAGPTTNQTTICSSVIEFHPKEERLLFHLQYALLSIVLPKNGTSRYRMCISYALGNDTK